MHCSTCLLWCLSLCKYKYWSAIAVQLTCRSGTEKKLAKKFFKSHISFMSIMVCFLHSGRALFIFELCWWRIQGPYIITRQNVHCKNIHSYYSWLVSLIFYTSCKQVHFQTNGNSVVPSRALNSKIENMWIK